jgi:two-component system chemotaxis sensor kinase CheA
MGRILIAEDEETVSSLLEFIISSKGHEVHVSPDGEHALKTLQGGEDFDLLLTDIKMPKMDGRQLIESLQKQEKLADLPIVIMSGYVGIEEMEDLLKAGVKAYLPKPVNLKELDAHINEIVNC